jgi:hypothetical protein
MQRASVVLIVSAFVAGCSGSSSAPSAPPNTTPQVRVVLPFAMFAGESEQAHATAANVDVSTQASWQSSSPGVATVSAGGIVTAISPGSTQLTATYQGGSASDTLVVSRDSDLISVLLSSCTGPLIAGQTIDCGAIANIQGVIGSPNVGSKATWSSSNPAVLSAGANGHVTAVTPGVATVSATYRGKIGSFAIAVTAVSQGQSDELRVTGGASTGPFKVGNLISISLNVTYTVISADTGQLTMGVSNQSGVAIGPPNTHTVNRGSGAAGMTAAFTVPQGTTQVCAIAILQVGSKVVFDPNAAPFCVSIDP